MKWIKSRGNRADIVVITKVGSDVWGRASAIFPAPDIKTRIEASLKRLQTITLDLYICLHWHVPGTPVYKERLACWI